MSQCLDFCHQILGTSVVADLTYQDEFSPNNLTAANVLLKRKGFLVDYFVRPPVKLTFTFEQPIWLSHLTFCPKVLSQTSQIFEVWTDSVRLGKGPHLASSGNPEVIVFQNFAFPGNKFGTSQSCRSKLRLAPADKLTAIKSLEIRILKTLNSSVPCLSNLCIWGRISATVPKEHKDDLLLRWSALQKRNISVSTLQDQPCHSKACSQTVTQKIDETNSIPNDFLDAITFERMNIPMVLPSGQVIDKTTLDEHTVNESKWGRPANDPFTGLPFTESQKPIFDSILKSRIDSFVLSSNGLSLNNSLKRKLQHEPNQDQPVVAKKQQTAKSESLTAYSGKNLDALLGEALASRKPILNSKRTRCCCQCTSSTNLYQISCQHKLYCRDCLKQPSTKNTCDQCQSVWTTKDVAKYHHGNSEC